jgi:hypothetical protein
MADDLDEPYALPPEASERFREDGFVHLTGVLSPSLLERYRVAISASVSAFNTLDLPMAERDTYQKAFLQVMNLWRRDATVRRFVFGRRLARIAAELMGVAGVRLYHDQALYKEPGGGHTPWHADQYYWPLASESCCTAWVPLQDTPLPMGPLAFAAGSQRVDFGRDLPISDESESEVARALERARLTQVERPFALGDVSFHAGWTFHRAGENATPRMREVMTVIYMDAEMRLAAPRNPNQQLDWEAWCPGARVGERIETPLNPVLFP